jgi:tellurite resistance protein TehA-like permease
MARVVPFHVEDAMAIVEAIMQRARGLDPGSFALVMATGIVSVDLRQHGMPWLAQALFWLNLCAYAWLLALSALRLLRHREEMAAHFATPGHGAAFLTLAAATCVLGTQCVLVVRLPALAWLLAALGAAFWLGLVYLFFFVAITRRTKASFSHTIHGGWLVVVVATQALAVLAALLSVDGTGAVREGLLFTALCLYLLGCAWYLLLITLVVYRMVLLPLHAREFTPPYWIDMGALAISTLAGALIVLNAPAHGPLADLLPFVKGFSVFFWATATWWIPLLAILETWRHTRGRVPVRYEVDDWDIVFPLAMYTVGTYELARALDADWLLAIPGIGVYVSLLVWALVAGGMVKRLLGGIGREHRQDAA